MVQSNNNNKNISINLQGVTFPDKLVYIMLECICYYLINNSFRLNLNIDFERIIPSDGAKYSPLVNCQNNQLRFIKRFYKDIDLKHLRRIIKFEECSDSLLSELGRDIFYFFKHQIKIISSINKDLTEVIVELIGNALEHGRSDCLIDIDVTGDDYYKYEQSMKTNIENHYFGINVVILDFSGNKIYDELKNRFNNQEDIINRYKTVTIAQKYHLDNLNDYYHENDFYTLVAFQDRISGVTEKGKVGGRGLSRLIKSLEEQSDSHDCYVLSGNRCLNFKKEHMQYDSNGFIGFNSQNDFFGDIPEIGTFVDCPTYFPGTAYNLTFVVKRG